MVANRCILHCLTGDPSLHTNRHPKGTQAKLFLVCLAGLRHIHAAGKACLGMGACGLPIVPGALSQEGADLYPGPQGRGSVGLFGSRGALYFSCYSPAPSEFCHLPAVGNNHCKLITIASPPDPSQPTNRVKINCWRVLAVLWESHPGHRQGMVYAPKHEI